MKHTVAALVLVAVFAPSGTAQVFDASVQFSPTSNLNSVWRYGFEPALGSGFTISDTAGSFTSFSEIDTWT